MCRQRTAVAGETGCVSDMIIIRELVEMVQAGVDIIVVLDKNLEVTDYKI